ncbi:ArsR/SmtB family transcription factor [Desulforamulus aquiferis]|uniref:Metalloregulator ArsR/SmtB family transcription factor n=1 Tax=Desulforamulus aquiferis TaxID=1397668 RepID=A0AAW7ZD92_9FIRM|nr:metalloregulator ArsR/SmtB family transcription factor [Desulforamulus aquiferis]MDO7787658.1 metalloregulator ArsR/SmtB family transcription factor [Desulforamulus aquiferis]RYD05973.1 regulatory protein ArsR [Desulforamulus aquiferis]
MIDTVKISKALSDPIRYKIMLMLAQTEEGCCPMPGEDDRRPGLCNCELMSELGLIQSRVSYHMKELTQAGLVTEEPRGKWKIYFINTATFRKFIKQIEKDFALK